MTAAPMSQCPDLARKEHSNILLFHYLVVFAWVQSFVDGSRSAMFARMLSAVYLSPSSIPGT